MKKLPGIILLLLVVILGNAQPNTYCNPSNLDYGYTPIPTFWNADTKYSSELGEFNFMVGGNSRDVQAVGVTLKME
jgi:hypothetical protein